MKNIYIFLFALVLFVTPVCAQTIDTLAKQAIIVDYDTGAVLFEKNADEKMPTSSMSKVMTIYAAFEALKNGKVSMEDTMPVSEKAWRMQGSKMFVDLGSSIKVGDLLRGVIIQSGNDATIVLAEGLAGTEEAFASVLNTKAKELGMTQSHFTNASGWPDPNHYSTARDLSVLGRAIIKDFPDYYPIYSEKEFTYNSIKQGNRNPLLYRNIGADGIKTGHAEEAGYGLIGTGIENNRRVVIVVNGLTSQQERADESAKLLQWGLRSFENKNLIKADVGIENAPVVFGVQKDVPLVLTQDLIMTVPKLQDNPVHLQIKYMSPLIAPVKKGDKIGTLSLRTSSNTTAIEYPVFAAADVAELGFFPKAIAKAKYMIGIY